MLSKQLFTYFVAISMLSNASFAASASTEVLMLDLDPATNGISVEMKSESAIEAEGNFERYMRGEISSQQMAEMLLSNPAEYRNKINAVGTIIKENQLLTGDQTIANKIYRLQFDLNEQILKYNEMVERRRAKASRIGKTVGFVAGYASAVVVDRYTGQTAQHFFLNLVLFTAGGVILGHYAANAYDSVTKEGKFEQNEILDSNK